MKLQVLLTGLGCLTLGVIIGRLVPGADEVKEGEQSTPGREVVTHRMETGRTEQGRLVRRSGAGRETSIVDLDSGLEDPDRDGKLVVVPAALIARLSEQASRKSRAQDLFSQSGEIEALLQISDAEKKQVQQAWRATCKQMRQYESNAAEAKDLDDGSVQITVPDMSLAMQGFGDDFQASLKQALGENRADVFAGIKQTKRILAPVEGEQVYRVKMESTGDGQWRYQVSDVSPGRRRVWVGGIPESIRHLTDAAKIKPMLNPVEDDEDE